MSENIDPLMNKNGDVGQEVLAKLGNGPVESELIDVKLLSSFIAVDCNILIEKEGDAGALQPYIVEMSSNQEKFIPTMDAKAMRAFSRNNKQKQGSRASGPVVVTDHEVSSSTVSDKLVSKKSCTEKEPIPTSVPLSPNQEVVQIGTSSQPLLVTPGIPKWWHWFQGFEGQPGTEVVSVFDRRLPTEQLIRSHFLKTDDFVRVKKVGMVNTAKMVQVFAAQTAVLGQALEKELKEKTKKLKDGQAEVAKAKEAVSELARLQEEFKALSLEREKAVADLDVLKKEKEDSDTLLAEKTKLLEKAEEKLTAEQKGRKEESDHLKAEITFSMSKVLKRQLIKSSFCTHRLTWMKLGPSRKSGMVGCSMLQSSAELRSATPLYVTFAASPPLYVMGAPLYVMLQSSVELRSATPLYVTFVASPPLYVMGASLYMMRQSSAELRSTTPLYVTFVASPPLYVMGAPLYVMRQSSAELRSTTPLYVTFVASPPLYVMGAPLYVMLQSSAELRSTTPLYVTFVASPPLYVMGAPLYVMRQSSAELRSTTPLYVTFVASVCYSRKV
ncbi:hypothetical protein SESBI_31837 [Sesbania bispinosa]|nr:hypothetical protein SESBI_31837 [Sesbania bispinosa]